MAVDVSSLSDPKTPAIDLYRANNATPETFEEFRFWITNELNRIQAMGISSDEAVLLIAQAIEELASGGTEGPAGADGAPGVAGVDGRGIHTYTQTGEPSGAFPGDVWFKEG